MGKALYRKYRPKCLTEVVGEPQVTDVLSNALKSGKISHAYLFVGPRGCGKTSVARIFAHEINKFKYELEDDYVDIIEIDAASNTGVDNIRELREKAAIAPTKGKYKVYIIDEVHMLSKSAFNALLKTLEEPPKHVIFIMATTDAYKVPVTITSRSQVYTFKLADAATMQTHLRTICDKEGIKITDDALNLIVKRGGGSFRDSLSLLEQISTLSDGEITKEQIISALGLPEDEIIASILNDYMGTNIDAITTKLKNLFDANVKAETILEELIGQILGAPIPAYIPLLAKLSDIKAPFIEAKLLVALCGQVPIATIPAPAAAIASAPQPKPAPATQPAPVPKPTPTPEPTPDPEPISQPAPEPSPSPTPAPAAQKVATNSKDFLGNISDAGIYQQVAKTIISETTDTIHIYPKSKVAVKILSSPNHKKVLIDAAGGKKVEIHEVGELPPQAPSASPTVSAISSIMGGAEEISKDKMPF